MSTATVGSTVGTLAGSEATQAKPPSGFLYVLRFVRHPLFALLVAALNASDSFILVVPNEVLLVAAVLARPTKWFYIAAIVSFGSMIGAVSLAWVMQQYPDALRNFLPSVFASSSWTYAESLFQQYGQATSFFSAVGPLPMPPFVLVGAASGIPLPTICVFTFVGRLIKYSGISYAAVKAPNLLPASFKVHAQSTDAKKVE